MKKLNYIIICSLLTLGVMVTPFSAIAASGEMYLTSTIKTIAQEGAITLNIRLDSGAEKVNAVQVNISYPNDRLELLGINYGDSAFPIEMPLENANGIIKIARAATGQGVSGDKSIANVTFKAKNKAGTATVSIMDGSAMVKGSDQSNLLRSKKSATFTITNAVASPQPIVLSESAKGLQIENIKLTRTRIKDVTIEWTTATDSSSYIEYGLTQTYGLATQSAQLTKNHKLALDAQFLNPATTYHYRVQSRDAALNEAKTEDKTFTTNGYKVQITIHDQNNKPVPKARIAIVDRLQSGTSDSEGKVLIEDLPTGENIVSIEVGTQNKQERSIQIKDLASNGEDENYVQPFTLKVEVKKLNLLPWMIIGGIVSASILAYLFYKLKSDAKSK
ncbi:MAG: cohesin domain-containing protein [bacterium]|nr:cohesin domain-containing protein [bacterium]